MKLFVSFQADLTQLKVKQASNTDRPEEVARLAQASERALRIWTSWAEGHGGKAIYASGDEGKLEIEADHLSELPGIKEQYEGALESTCSVGVGTQLSEADKSLEAARASGGDKILLYTEEVEDILKEKEGLKKTDPAMNAGSNAGFSGASRSEPEAPQKMKEGSEHSENEVLRSEIDNAPPAPEAPKQASVEDYEQLFHQLAAQQSQQEQPQEAPPGVADGVREKVIAVLQQIRQNAPSLEQMKSSNPDLYQSLTGAIQAMIAMAQATLGDETQPEQVAKAEKEECKHFYGKGTKCLKCKVSKEDLEKAALEAGKTGRHQVVLPVGSQIDAGPSAAHEAGEIKVAKPDGTSSWRSVRAGLVMDSTDGTPISSRRQK